MDIKRKYSVFQDIYHQPYNDMTRIKLYKSSKGSADMIQRMSLLKKLTIHSGCVNTICWNETGEYLLSGSDDQHLVITNGHNYKVLTDYKTSHRANIFSAKFLPGSPDNRIISCSGDGIILYSDLLCQEETSHNQFNCHTGTTYDVITVPNDSNTFLSCGEDGTVRWFDLRVKNSCNKSNCQEDIMISCHNAVTALSVNPVAPYQLAIGCSDSTVRIFDRRMLGSQSDLQQGNSGRLRPLCSFTLPKLENRSFRITSLCFSPDGEEILVSYSSDHLYLFGVKDYGQTTLRTAELASENIRKSKKRVQRSPPQVRRLRLRGDWSDTGPDARPEREGGRREVAQARPTLHATLMQRMTDVLSRMLNDPATRAALSGAGDDDASVDEEHDDQHLIDPPANPEESQRSESAPLEYLDQDMENQSEAQVPVRDSTPSHPTPNQSDANAEPATSTNQATSLQASSAPQAPMSSEPNSQGLNSSTSSSATSTSMISSTNRTSTTLASDSESDPDPPSDPNFSQVHDKLTSLRAGFIERHGTEPAVNLTFSEQSTRTGQIRLDVANPSELQTTQSRQMENDNSNPVAGPSHQATFPKRETAQAQQQPFNSSQSNHSEDDEDGEDCRVFHGFSDESDEDDNHSSSRYDEDSPMEEDLDSMVVADYDKDQMFDDKCRIRPTVRQKFTGHRNARTMIKEATFWGDKHILSGSDCGHVFCWDRDTAQLVMLLEADHHVVNCLQPHPTQPLLATSGIDYDVKLWAPLHKESAFDYEMAQVLTKRNEVMLEETKDTITVPASFMIRMLACLNQIRRGGRSRRGQRRQTIAD